MATKRMQNVTHAADSDDELAPAGISILFPRPHRRSPEVLTEPEVIALIRACSSRAPTGVRNGR